MIGLYEKLSKKWAVVLLAFCMIFAIVPGAAFASETTTAYDLYIGDMQVTSGNAEDVLGDGGTVSYNAETGVLTLNNTVVSKPIYRKDAIGPDLGIEVLGNNTINSTGDGIGIGGNLYFKGDGVLNINATASDGVVGIRAKNVTVDGIKLNIKSVDSSIYAEASASDTPLENDQTVTIRNGAGVNVSSENGYGIFAMKDISISDSSVTAVTKGGKNARALSAAEGEMTIDSSVVDAQQISEQGGQALRSKGNMKIAKSEVRALSKGHAAIWTNADLTVDDSKVRGTSNAAPGADAFNIRIVNDSELEAIGGVGFRSKYDSGSLAITPKAGSLADLIVGDNTDGSDAKHFKDGDEASPYQAATFTGTDILTKLCYTENGYFHVKPHVHVGGEATCTAKAKCEVCGNEYGEFAAHDFKWVIDKEATIAEKGSKHEECSVCGYAKAAIEIPALENSVDKDKDKNENENVSTGDDSNIAPWIAIMSLAAIGLTGAVVYGKKRKISK